jgi:type VI secretion system secreted protein VgrG
VENDRYTKIAANDHLTVDGERRIKVSGDHSAQLGASLQQKVGSLTAVQAGSGIHLKSGAKIVVEAGAEVTLKAGGSFVNIGPAGVYLVGPAINLNAGGSASSAKAYAGKAATLPGAVEAALAPEAIKLPTITSTAYAAMASEGALAKELCTCGEGDTCPIHN